MLMGLSRKHCVAPVDGLGRESSADLVPVYASQVSCSQVGLFLRGEMLAFLADGGGMGTGCFDGHFPFEDTDVSAAGFLQYFVTLGSFALHPRVCVILCNQCSSSSIYLLSHTAGHVSSLSFFQTQGTDERLQFNPLIPK